MSRFGLFHSTQRIFAFVAVFLINANLAAWLGPLVLHFADAHFPGVFFYHLGPDEESGPIGDPVQVLWAVLVLGYAIFVAVVIPPAFFLRIRWPIIVVAAVLNVPAIVFLEIHHFLGPPQ